MSLPCHRWLSAIALLLWLAPSASALAVAAHVALEHHEQHDAAHAVGARESAARGAHRPAQRHHDDIGGSQHHHHEASVEEAASVLRPSQGMIAGPPLPSFDPGPAPRRTEAPRRSRGGPPSPLFTTHCSLLL